MSIIFKELLSMGEKIILKPKIERLYSYNSIINGIKVKNRKMCALAGNTFRAFPRIDKNKVGASKVFRDYFSDNEKKILANLKGLQKQHQFDKFLNSYCKEIEEKLIGVIKNSEFGSFNKIRKPVDITIEHLVAMAKEFTNEDRQKLVPMLRLPLSVLLMAQ